MTRKRNDRPLEEMYCQQHFCDYISECTRSWKNMPRGKIFLCEKFKPNKDGKCDYYTTERLNIKEVER